MLTKQEHGDAPRFRAARPGRVWCVWRTAAEGDGDAEIVAYCGESAENARLIARLLEEHHGAAPSRREHEQETNGRLRAALQLVSDWLGMRPGCNGRVAHLEDVTAVVAQALACADERVDSR